MGRLPLNRVRTNPKSKVVGLQTSWTGSCVYDGGNSGKGLTFFAMHTPIPRREGSPVPPEDLIWSGLSTPIEALAVFFYRAGFLREVEARLSVL